jgi:type VI secretion system protein VasD
MAFFYRAIAVLVFFLSLSGCSSTPKPAKLMTNIQSVNYLNPNLDNQAAPVVVTFYQLKSPDNFKQADFFALHNKPTETLAADLLDKRELEVRPDKILKIEQNVAPSATYLGIVAAYRNPDVAEWKQLVEIPQDTRRIRLNLNLETQRLSAKIID